MSNHRHWMQTYTQRAFRYDQPYDLEIHPEDIIRPLCVLPRFSGHASYHLTVAEHSLVVAKMVELDGGSDLAVLHALMHDAHEAFTGDIPSPFKRYLRDEWAVDINEIQATFQTNILAALDIPMLTDIHSQELITQADIRACKIERDLFMSSNLQWDIDDIAYPPSWRDFYLRLSPGECSELFSKRYYDLRKRGGQC